MNALTDIQHIFVDEELFFQSVLSRADLFPDESSDAVYIYDQDYSLPEVALEFSTYDGFALKNILRGVLNIPVSILSSNDRYASIIEHRVEVLKCAQFYPNIQNKAAFLVNFCRQQNCNLSAVLYFGNDHEVLTSFADSDSPIIVTTEKNLPKEISEQKNTFISRQPHAIRQWVDEQTQSSPEVCAYYDETRQLSTETAAIKTETPHSGLALFLDIDGTCTDGMMIFADDGSVWKRFSKRDIRAIQQWNQLGKAVFFVTGAKNFIPSKLAELTNTPSDHVLLKAGSQKLQNVFETCIQHGINYRNVIYVGDDCNDLGVMEFLAKNGGYIACPQSAIPAIKAIAHVTQNAGGHGAVAEIIAQLLAKTN